MADEPPIIPAGGDESRWQAIKSSITNAAANIRSFNTDVEELIGPGGAIGKLKTALEELTDRLNRTAIGGTGATPGNTTGSPVHGSTVGTNPATFSTPAMTPFQQAGPGGPSANTYNTSFGAGGGAGQGQGRTPSGQPGGVNPSSFSLSPMQTIGIGATAMTMAGNLYGGYAQQALGVNPSLTNLQLGGYSYGQVAGALTNRAMTFGTQSAQDTTAAALQARQLTGQLGPTALNSRTIHNMSELALAPGNVGMSLSDASQLYTALRNPYATARTYFATGASFQGVRGTSPDLYQTSRQILQGLMQRSGMSHQAQMNPNTVYNTFGRTGSLGLSRLSDLYGPQAAQAMVNAATADITYMRRQPGRGDLFSDIQPNPTTGQYSSNDLKRMQRELQASGQWNKTTQAMLNNMSQQSSNTIDFAASQEQNIAKMVGLQTQISKYTEYMAKQMGFGGAMSSVMSGGVNKLLGSSIMDVILWEQLKRIGTGGAGASGGTSILSRIGLGGGGGTTAGEFGVATGTTAAGAGSTGALSMLGPIGLAIGAGIGVNMMRKSVGDWTKGQRGAGSLMDIPLFASDIATQNYGTATGRIRDYVGGVPVLGRAAGIANWISEAPRHPSRIGSAIGTAIGGLQGVPGAIGGGIGDIGSFVDKHLVESNFGKISGAGEEKWALKEVNKAYNKWIKEKIIDNIPQWGKNTEKAVAALFGSVTDFFKGVIKWLDDKIPEPLKKAIGWGTKWLTGIGETQFAMNVGSDIGSAASSAASWLFGDPPAGSRSSSTGWTQSFGDFTGDAPGSDDTAFLLTRNHASETGPNAVLKLDPKFRHEVAAMLRDNPSLYITSGWRDTTEQAAKYQHYIHFGGPEVAPPGHSMHEKGLAVDLGPPGQFGWLHGHGGHYGLVNYEPEPWHWEPAGASTAGNRSNYGVAADPSLVWNGSGAGAAGSGDVSGSATTGTPTASGGVALLTGSAFGFTMSQGDMMSSLLGAPTQGGSRGVQGAIAPVGSGAASGAAAQGTGAGGGGAGSGGGNITGGATGGSISPAKLYKDLRTAGFTAKGAAAFVAIAGGESGYKVDNFNHNAGTGDWSQGLFQINLAPGPPNYGTNYALMKQAGLADPAKDLLTEAGSIKGVWAMFKSGGMYAWGGYKHIPWYAPPHGNYLQTAVNASGGEVKSVSELTSWNGTGDRTVGRLPATNATSNLAMISPPAAPTGSGGGSVIVDHHGGTTRNISAQFYVTAQNSTMIEAERLAQYTWKRIQELEAQEARRDS